MEAGDDGLFSVPLPPAAPELEAAREAQLLVESAWPRPRASARRAHGRDAAPRHRRRHPPSGPRGRRHGPRRRRPAHRGRAPRIRSGRPHRADRPRGADTRARLRRDRCGRQVHLRRAPPRPLLDHRRPRGDGARARGGEHPTRRVDHRLRPDAHAGGLHLGDVRGRAGGPGGRGARVRRRRSGRDGAALARAAGGRAHRRLRAQRLRRRRHLPAARRGRGSDHGRARGVAGGGGGRGGRARWGRAAVLGAAHRGRRACRRAR